MTFTFSHFLGLGVAIGAAVIAGADGVRVLGRREEETA